MRAVSSATISRAAERRRVVEAERSQAARLRRSLPSLDNPLGVAGICVLLALIFASVLFGGDFVPFTLRLTGVFGSSPPPTARVSDTGMIVFTPSDGNSCRVVTFSNRTGSFGPDQRVRCDDGLPPERDAPAVREAGPSDRMLSIRQAFTSRTAR
jgi:hypothetical protein